MEFPNSRALDLLLAHIAACPPGEGLDVKPGETEARRALYYLDRYGYLRRGLANWTDITVADIARALKSFQKWFRVRRSGTLDYQTVRAMEAPRCGCPDIIRSRHRDYRGRAEAATLPAWRKRSLTYLITAYLPSVDREVFRATVQQAFDAWTRYGNIQVQAAAGSQADIYISTGSGSQSNFDGPGGTLAWAYLPDGNDQPLNMKFDLAETWITSPSQRGILVLNVACHEFGHLLGLDHARVDGALMAPYYNAAVTAPQQNDDIPRFQARYGAKPTPPPDGGTPPPDGGTPPQRSRLVVEFAAAGSSITLNGNPIA